MGDHAPVTADAKQRADIITEREASIAVLDADLSHVRGEKVDREATIGVVSGSVRGRASDYRMIFPAVARASKSVLLILVFFI